METQELMAEIQNLPLVEQEKILAALSDNLRRLPEAPKRLTQQELEVQRRHCIDEGERVYKEKLRSILEPEHIGKFVAIEPGSGQYFLGATSREAMTAARAALPDYVFYLARVGYKAAHWIGSGRLATRR